MPSLSETTSSRTGTLVFFTTGSVVALAATVKLGLVLRKKLFPPPPAGPRPFSHDCRLPARASSLDAQGWRNEKAASVSILKNVYKPSKIPAELDAIVIGSGIGGLTTAVLLAKAGKKVLVLEQHDQAGGCCHSFNLKGFEYDPGVHYVGQMHRNTFPRFLLEYLTKGQLVWSPMHPAFDTAVFMEFDGHPAQSQTSAMELQVPKGGRAIPFIGGPNEEYVEALKREFPKDAADIDRLFAYINAHCRDSTMFIVTKLLPRWLSHLVMWLPYFGSSFRRFYAVARRSTSEVLREFIHNDQLIATLSYFWGDTGALPSDSTFFMHASLTAHYKNGSAYPLGGSWQIPRHLIPNITEAGGAVLVQAQVARLLEENHRIVGVEMANDGAQIYAPMVISDAGALNTFLRLLPGTLKHKVPKWIKEHPTNRCPSLMSIFIGLRGNAEELGLTAQQYWVFRTKDHEADVRSYFAAGPEAAMKNLDEGVPCYFLSFPSAKDPAQAMLCPDQSTCTIITPLPYEWFEEWANQRPTTRGEAYEELKNAIGEAAWRQTCKLFPHLADKVEFFDVSSPVTMEHYLQSIKGSPYGMDHDIERFTFQAAMATRPDTGIPGLFLTGQDVFCCGVCGALMGGLIGASAALRTNLFTDAVNLYIASLTPTATASSTTEIKTA